MRNLLLLAFGLLILAGCHKDVEIKVPSHNFMYIENHQLYLDPDQRIVKIITSAVDASIKWEADYVYTDSLVIKTTLYSSGEKKTTRFKKGKNGFAEFSVDSSRNNFYKDTTRYFYHVDGYLLSSVTGPPSYYDDSTHFSYSEGDLVNVQSYNSYYASYSYYDTLNKIDLIWNDYGNGIAGKITRHLIKQESFGVPIVQYDYQYSLNQDGYVTERIKTLVQDIRYGSNIQKDRFTYIFNYAP